MKSTRLGFHLVELLVVLAILSIAVMLFLAFLPKPHGDYGLMRTRNNLRQCAIAIHNYHGTYDRLPNAASTGGIYKEASAARSMWFHLLPFVEADNVYKNNVHNAVVSAYLAPSDPYVGETDGKINYAANIRLFGYQTLDKELADNAVGASGNPTGATLSGRLAETMESGLTLEKIADGRSNVILLTTRYADCGSLVQSTYYSASPVGTLLTKSGPEVKLGGVLNRIGEPDGAPRGAFFGAGAHNTPADRTSLSAIFQVAPTAAQCRADDSVFGHSFSSGGLLVALADASVKSIDPNISTTTFCRALCPSDGHRLDNDWNADD